MPQIFRFGSYWVYFWTNENKPLEPIHVHISQGHPSANATKIWITKTGKCLLCNNNSKNIGIVKTNKYLKLVSLLYSVVFCIVNLKSRA